MDSVWQLCRFLGSVASYYITPTPPDFELVRAEGDEKRDLTPQLITWLAVSLYSETEMKKPWQDDERLLLYYRYRGAGPFAVYFDKGDAFVYPPAVEEVKPVELCLVSAEVERAGEIIDLLEEATAFSGPDGRWNGRLKQGGFDVKMLYPDMKEGDKVVLSFADGGDLELSLPTASITDNPSVNI